MTKKVYVVWDKYLETQGVMVKDFETQIATVDTTVDRSSFYTLELDIKNHQESYDLTIAPRADLLEKRYTVIKELI